jgi:phosphatidylinositol glycan class O
MIWRNDRVEQNDNKSYNQFKYLDKLRRYNRSNAMMFGFRADSPTTTSQRLKGILTGNFPTFMEIGVNFNSKRIVEDSLMKQWKLNTRRMVMLGDDTWMKLFPSDYFTTSYPFPSFDTTDLDTVDEGIRRYLWGYFTDGGKGKSTLDINCTAVLDSDYGGGGVLNSSPVDWDVLIAHFLGVDHIGHTHSAMHPLMGHRLREMDKVLEEIVEKMSNDSLLLMFGDHGMTNEGEHGS